MSRYPPAGEAARLINESRAGVVIPPGDASALATAIRRLAAAPEDCARMGRAGREFVLANFDRKTIAAQLEAHLTAMISGKG